MQNKVNNLAVGEKSGRHCVFLLATHLYQEMILFMASTVLQLLKFRAKGVSDLMIILHHNLRVS